MTDIYRNGAFEADLWRILAEGEVAAAGDAVIVPAARFLAERDQWIASPARLGLLIGPADKVEALTGDLALFETVAVAFPKFNDGRGFSHARHLSERLGYKGEIRAVGEVLLDQIPLMLRVGITAFAIDNEPTRRALTAGHLPVVPFYYQPAADNAAAVSADRPWLRQLGKVRAAV